MGKDTTLASVNILVTGVVSIGSWVDKCIVELGLANVGLETIDFLESDVGVE